jgi:hypothetical protein
VNPFIGLRPFEPKEARRLFGRDRDLALVSDRVLSARTTLLFASSGVGKTSFLNAKLIPQMTARYQVFICRHWTGVQPRVAILRVIEEGLTPEQRTDAALQHTLTSPAVTLLDLFKLLDSSGCLLVLDQFEEVFLSATWDDEFGRFLDELSALINDDRLEVRVVLSMREEFLGELSVFDNRVPDLFYNYYRLKHPTREEGHTIIARTCAQQGTAIDEERVQWLLADLSKTLRGSGVTKRSRGTGALEEVETDRIVLPYTQLVCEMLWEKTPRGRAFLASYRKGDAGRIRDNFAADKLSNLEWRDQRLLSQALEHLITRRGAKMPCEVTSLSEILHVKRRTLVDLLKRLAAEQPRPRVLKETIQLDGTMWFELYHDMYAPVLYRWKEAFQHAQELERRQNMKELREWRGVRPAEIAEWEQSIEALEEFWVYLPDFLADDERIADQIIDVMAANLQKNTRYLYIVEDRDDVTRLLKLIGRLRRHDAIRDRNVGAMVSVLVLRGSGDNGVAQAVSGLLHLGNCWIANPRTDRAEGYEVAFDEHGTVPVGGRTLPAHKLRRIVRNVAAIIDAFTPPTFEGVESEADIARLVDRSPRISIERPGTGVPSSTIAGTA